MGGGVPLSKGEKATVGCIVILVAIVTFVFLAIVITGLYLAVHNWG